MSSRQRKATWLIIATLALSMTLVGAVGSAGAAAAPTVLATGLMTPRFVTVGPDNAVYVSEAGMGGEEKIAGGPDSPGGDGSRGYTGQVTKIAPNGTKTVVAKGLPSYAAGQEAVGPAGIVYANGMIWLAISALSPEIPGLTPLTNEGTVVKIDPASGAVTKVADLLAYERANNPDGYGINSNPYGMTLGADGNLYVADAGANALYQVNPATGAIKVQAVIPGVAITREDLPPGTIPPDAPVANPDRGGKPEVDPVPTAVAPGADGSLYVTLLPGALLPNKAKVVRVAANGAVSDVVGGLTTLVGAAAGPDGNLYVSSLTSGFAPDGPPKPGGVMRVLAGGKTEMVAEPLPLVGGIDFDDAGNLYVVAFTINPGPQPQGQVVRFDGVAKAAPAPPSTGSGGNLPGLPNTGAGGAERTALPLAGLVLTLALGGSLFAIRRREA